MLKKEQLKKPLLHKTDYDKKIIERTKYSCLSCPLYRGRFWQEPVGNNFADKH